MFLRSESGFELAGGTAARGVGRLAVAGAPATGLRAWGDRTRDIDWVPDLGMRIGSRDWWRGLATCTALCAATWAVVAAASPPRSPPLCQRP